tara:strand:+ start:592 stop:1662 length:1071 start_codon:yes stop_codon:yes gene_type:complete
MSYTNGLDDPSAYFQTKIYSGSSNSQALTFDGNSDLSPNMIWLKRRSAGGNGFLYDTVRGANRSLVPNDADAEDTSGESTNYLTSFDSDGFTVAGGYNNTNNSGSTYVGWGWKASTTGSGTTNGSKAYSYSASPDAGFSVVTYTGNATAGHLIPHGMGKVPRLIHIKSRGDDNGWTSGSIASASGWNDHGYLHLNNAFGTDANQFGATPDTTNFRLGTGTGTNGNNGTRVAYCFADVQGYQKIGKFVGNDSTNGSTIFCGFKPAWVLVKRLDAAESYFIYDNKRNAHVGNERYYVLKADASSAENQTYGDNWQMDFLSNGFKLRTTAGHLNSGNLLFHAIAENPFVTSSGIPTTAK